MWRGRSLIFVKNNMNILMGNNTLDILAGSETWIYTLAAEMVKQGHKVTAFSHSLGFIATKLESLGVKCISEINSSVGGKIKPFSPFLEESSDEKYDVIICNHYAITRYMHDKLPNIPIIATVHGILHGEGDQIWPEHPVTEFKVDQYISVSEEVQDKLKSSYGIDSIIIRNFFDLERFKKEKKKIPEGKQPEKFLVNSNYWGKDDEINMVIKDTANFFNAQFMGIGVNFAQTWETEEVIGQVDVVWGMGRSVIEGACMGKLSVIHGRWGTGGVLTPESYEVMKKTNFSGRKYGGEANSLAASSDLVNDINAYFNSKNIDAVYKIIKENHDVKKAAAQFVEIANKLISEKICD